jgi:hypothetical protein
MKMFYRWKIGCQFIHPLHSFYVLTFGAIPITTRIVGLNFVGAMIAIQSMPAKFGGATGYNIFQCFLLNSTNRMVAQKVVFVIPENVSNLDGLLFILHCDSFRKDLYHLMES